MKPDFLFEYQEIEEMNLPENLLSMLRDTLDDVMLSKKSEKVCCDLTHELISLKSMKVALRLKDKVEFWIFPSGLIMILTKKGEVKDERKRNNCLY